MPEEMTASSRAGDVPLDPDLPLGREMALNGYACGDGDAGVEVHFPDLTPLAARTFRWFTVAAIAVWIGCSLWPIAAMLGGRFSGMPAVLFVLMFALYGAATLTMLTLPRRARQVPRWLPLALASLQTAAGIGLNADTTTYLGGTGIGLGLLVIVAAELPYLLPQRWTWTWIVLQSVVLAAVVSRPGSTPGVDIATFTIAALGFQVFAAASSILALNEGLARTRLARANAELTAARERLAERSKTAERLRISRDLHDTLGHHLAALSLQLDVASRLAEGRAVEHIEQAHAITRLLLADVRDLVGMLRETSRVNVVEAIGALAAHPVGGPLEARVHLELPEAFAIDDAERAEVVCRVVQEALTNAARHSDATNLWIRLAQSEGGVTLDVRDDGRGAESVAVGNGLRGMCERLAEHGGRVEFRTAAGAGFELQAFIPYAGCA